ncbi:glycosyltransferase [Kaistia adipata]|uniref:glycosyltransferase n=1 Tax=Kaistia adipata TaxID=166954 RepID=UPI000421D322|nr:glycosyltransferase [Kaistia adipata]
MNPISNEDEIREPPIRAGADRGLDIAMVMGRISRSSGGIFEAVSGLAPAVAARPGQRVGVYGLDDPLASAGVLQARGVPVHAYPSHGPRSFGYAPALARALRSSPADLLHVHGLWMYPSVVAPRWAVARHRPYIVSPHGQLDRWALAHRGWKKRLASLAYERRHLQHAACLHALCPAELASIRAAGLTNPVCVVPNGVDLQEHDRGQPPLWRPQVAAEATILLFLGRLAPQKGIPNLLHGLARARQAISLAPWHLVVAGWGEATYRSQLERLGASLGLGDIVHFVGPQFGEQKLRTLAAADAFVLPSLSEGLPIAVLEAWAAGLPVLMTPQCNLQEGFAEAGAIRIEADADGVEAGLRRLFAMPPQGRRQVGELARRFVADRYSWAGAADEMEAVYRWVLGVGERPRTVHLA